MNSFCDTVFIIVMQIKLFVVVVVVSRSNWNLEMLVFVEGGKPEYPEKNPRSRDENQQQTQPSFGVNSGNRTRVLSPRAPLHPCI